jgi:hypothetical protein
MLNTEKWTTEGDIPNKAIWPMESMDNPPETREMILNSLNGGRCHIFDKRKVNHLKLSSLLT